MLDLSNNNGVHHDFNRAYQSGHRRLYLKATEGASFTDSTFGTLAAAARRAGFRVGAYHFATAKSSPAVEARHFLAALRPHGATVLGLRPCLDLERSGSASPALGRWATDWLRIVERELELAGLLYSYASFVTACRFARTPAPLWLASYGRDDGREHPFTIPGPWHHLAAHQYTSRALVPGIRGRCDVSRVIVAGEVDRKAK